MAIWPVLVLRVSKSPKPVDDGMDFEKIPDVLLDGGEKVNSCAAESDEPYISADSTAEPRKNILKDFLQMRRVTRFRQLNLNRGDENYR